MGWKKKYRKKEGNKRRRRSGRKGGTNRRRRGNESNKSKERKRRITGIVRGREWRGRKREKGEKRRRKRRGKKRDRNGKREEGEESESKRAEWCARAPLPGLYGNVGQIYHSGLTVQFSYLPRAACRSTPNHPSSRGGWSCWWRRSRATGNGDAGIGGLKRPIEDLQTRCPPLSLLFVLTHPLTLFCWHPPPSLVPSVQPTLSTNLPHPFTTTILLLSSSVTVRSAPTDDSTTWRTAERNESRMWNFVNKRNTYIYWKSWYERLSLGNVRG